MTEQNQTFRPIDVTSPQSFNRRQSVSQSPVPVAEDIYIRVSYIPSEQKSRSKKKITKSLVKKVYIKPISQEFLLENFGMFGNLKNDEDTFIESIMVSTPNCSYDDFDIKKCIYIDIQLVKITNGNIYDCTLDKLFNSTKTRPPPPPYPPPKLNIRYNERNRSSSLLVTIESNYENTRLMESVI